MPARDDRYRIWAVRLNRREMLRLTVFGGAGLAGVLAFGCGGEEEEKKGTPTALLATAAPSGFFDSDGVKIHYETFGAGKPLILVHGITSNLQYNWVYAGWTEALKATRLVVALDNRGHGQSEKPHEREAYAGDTMSQDVLRLMDYLGIEKADLFGYSMGVFNSLELLAHHRDRFDSVILGGIGKGFTFDSPETIQAISDGFAAEDPSRISDPWGKGFREAADAVPGNDLKALAACVYHLGEPIDYDDLASVDIPVLIVDGANDILARTPPELEALVPGSKLVTIPDTDHTSVVIDQRFKEAVLAFLEDQ